MNPNEQLISELADLLERHGVELPACVNDALNPAIWSGYANAYFRSTLRREDEPELHKTFVESFVVKDSDLSRYRLAVIDALLIPACREIVLRIEQGKQDPPSTDLRFCDSSHSSVTTTDGYSTKIEMLYDPPTAGVRVTVTFQTVDNSTLGVEYR